MGSFFLSPYSGGEWEVSMRFGLSQFGDDFEADWYLGFLPQAGERKIKKQKSCFSRPVEEKIVKREYLQVEVLWLLTLQFLWADSWKYCKKGEHSSERIRRESVPWQRHTTQRTGSYRSCHESKAHSLPITTCVYSMIKWGHLGTMLKRYFICTKKQCKGIFKKSRTTVSTTWNSAMMQIHFIWCVDLGEGCRSSAWRSSSWFWHFDNTSAALDGSNHQ